VCKLIPWAILIAMAAGLSALSVYCTAWLSDDNLFLRNFVNHELLATLGFIVAITLASAASLHIEFNRLEDETGQTFVRSRRSLRRSAYSLLILFGTAVALVVVKPILPEAPIFAALANSAALLIIYFFLAVMWDLTSTTLGMPTVKKINAIREESGISSHEKAAP